MSTKYVGAKYFILFLFTILLDLGLPDENTQCKSSDFFWNINKTTMETENNNKFPSGIKFLGIFRLSNMGQNK